MSEIETIEQKTLRYMRVAINYPADAVLPIEEMRKNETFVHNCKVVELAITEEREACKEACRLVREQDVSNGSDDYKIGRQMGAEVCFNQINLRGAPKAEVSE